MPSDKKSKKSKDRKRDAEEDDDRDSKRTKVEASERISSADYFAKNAPFTRWLRKKKGVYFDQLNAGRSRELFDDFVVKWNEGSLSSKYYTMDPIKPKSKERTGYTWSFVNKLDKSDKKGLQQLSDSVEESLTHDALGSGGAVPRSTPIPGAASTAAPARGSEKPARRVMLPAAPDAETLKAYSAQLQQKERRDYRAQDKLAHDEITGGKATGFERKLEKKADARAERLAREASPDVPGGDPYGGASSDFSAEVARRNARIEKKKESRKDAARAKLQEHTEKERAKLQGLLELAKATRSADALYQG
eukprot:m.446024 g.446024  ORF g.446024 m.446024 type:complete len:306 (+) comp19302_c0_seq1:269-1186(+)